MGNKLYAPSHQRAALPLHKLTIIIFGLLALVSIIGGIVAIIVDAKSETDLNILGAHLTTGHVGVVLVVTGLIMTFFTVRTVLKSQRDLAALPLDNYFYLPSDGNRKMEASNNELAEIISEAIREADQRDFSRIPFRPGEQTLKSALEIREYFGQYFDRIFPFVKGANTHSINTIAKLVERLYRETWLKHLLDSSIDSYVIQDYLREIVDIIHSKGGTFEHLDKQVKYLAQEWEAIKLGRHESGVDPHILDKAISRRPKVA